MSSRELRIKLKERVTFPNSEVGGSRTSTRHTNCGLHDIHRSAVLHPQRGQRGGQVDSPTARPDQTAWRCGFVRGCQGRSLLRRTAARDLGPRPQRTRSNVLASREINACSSDPSSDHSVRCCGGGRHRSGHGVGRCWPCTASRQNSPPTSPYGLTRVLRPSSADPDEEHAAVAVHSGLKRDGGARCLV